MSPRTAAKLEAWKRAGLYGPDVLREQIAVLEERLLQPVQEPPGAVNADLKELRRLLADLERPT